ncbi:unnamed protein product [Orchesella dallaii]|uniref:Chitinase n=1 Tax=Orchesella dallaii TaxID=48710 RepID=A0ABP1RMB7_9HEXA
MLVLSTRKIFFGWKVVLYGHLILVPLVLSMFSHHDNSMQCPEDDEKEYQICKNDHGNDLLVLVFGTLISLLGSAMALVASVIQEEREHFRNVYHANWNLISRLEQKYGNQLEANHQIRKSLKIYEYICAYSCLGSTILTFVFPVTIFHPADPFHRILEDVFGMSVSSYPKTTIFVGLVYGWLVFLVENTAIFVVISFQLPIFSSFIWINAIMPHQLVNDGGKKMVCYMGTWAMYRPGDGKFWPDDADPHLCTHLMYGFTKLENNVITVFDPWGDLKDEWGGGHNGYKRFTGLKEKNPDLKTLIAIGGWNEGSTKYSEMASNPSSRRTFVKSIVPFLEKYGFDGLDLDWEYPTQRGGKPEDRENFSDLVRELREEFDRVGRGYLLTAAVSPNTKTVEIGYEVPEIAQDLDFINVMCYDYHGFWDGHEFTGHNTPLYRHPKDETYEPFFNANDTVTYWLQAGLPKEKLIMGMALYGRGFTLARSEDHGLYAPTSGGIPQGPYTRQDGIWGYNEICEKFKEEPDQWKISINEHVKAPYAFNGRHWIGYEDVESIYYKAEYARNMDLGGAMVWSLETDDFKGKCHDEPYILLRTIVNTMNGGGMPSIPQRPEVIPEDSDYDNEIIEPEATTTRPPRTARPSRPSRRPATESPSGGDEPPKRTTRRPRPSRTTTQGPSTGDEPPKRTTRRPRPSRSTTQGPSTGDEPPKRTTRRPRPSRSTTQGPSTGDEPPKRTTRRPRPPRPPMTTEAYPDEQPSNPSGPAASPGNNNGKCTEEGIFPSGNCSGFYQCVRRGKGFHKIEQSCPAGTVFNPDIKTCDYPDSVDGCSARVRTADSYRRNGHGLAVAE